MKLYAGAVIVRKDYPYTTDILPVTVGGENKEEAHGTAVFLAREEYPNKEGWVGHDAHLMEVPMEYIQIAYESNFETSE